ncbi:hypothetical protein AAAU36_01750 [Phascolarctobacterium faecium]|uniref:hypothetical protein n=1 Tax=Phascolarctobacterium faecium TaxID=33025 RepID=UPI0015ABD154|nr:hypothetical protein [uncultured Phascolarctobacterium sp.]
MKLYLKIFAVIMATVVLIGCATEPRAKITVPVVVRQGDTLDSICIRIADEHGDVRDYREIVYYTQQRNEIQKFIYPGDIILVELEVERDDHGKSN